MKNWFSIVNSADGKRAEVRIHGAIVDAKWNDTDPDVTPADFARELEATAGASSLDIFINSPGGNVFAGLAIYHMLRRHPAAEKTVYNDGIIASIASVIAMAGTRVVMPRTSMMLIHKALVVGIGNADDFLSLAAELDKVDTTIAEAYSPRMKKPVAEVKEIMALDRFLTAEEALEFGLADELGEARDIEARLDGDRFVVNGQALDVSRFKNFPRDKFVASTPMPAPDMSVYDVQVQTNQNIIHLT